MERFEAPSTRTLRRISVHSSMSVRTLLPFCSSARARSLEAGPSRSGDAQVLPFWTVIPTRSGAAVFDRDLHPSELVAPAVEGGLGDLEVTSDLVNGLSLGQELVPLGQLSDDLLGRVSTSFHGVRSSFPNDGDRTRTTGGSTQGDPATVVSVRGFDGERISVEGRQRLRE